MDSTWLVVRETPAHRFAPIRREDIPALTEYPPRGLLSRFVARFVDAWHTWRGR